MTYIIFSCDILVYCLALFFVFVSFCRLYLLKLPRTSDRVVFTVRQHVCILNVHGLFSTIFVFILDNFQKVFFLIRHF